MLPPFQMVSDDLRIFKGRFEEIPFTASCRADEAMQSGGDGVHPWSAWVAMACTTPGCTALDDGDDADDVHSSAAWVTSAVQKIQKLSESPATAHMVAKLYVTNCQNRKITQKLVQPVTPGGYQKCATPTYQMGIFCATPLCSVCLLKCFILNWT